MADADTKLNLSPLEEAILEGIITKAPKGELAQRLNLTPDALIAAAKELLTKLDAQRR